MKNPLLPRPGDDAFLEEPLRRVPAARKPFVPAQRGRRIGTPEVVVKVIPGHRSGRGAVWSTLNYLTKDGEVQLIGPLGEVMEREDFSRLIDGFVTEHREGCRDIHHLVLSMPADTDRKAVAQAAEAVAREAFSDRQWIVAHHADVDHSHAHIVVAAVGLDGKRMLHGREEIQTWRERFARELAVRGIEARATPFPERADRERSEPLAVVHMRRRGVVPEKDKTHRQNVRDMARMLAAQERDPAAAAMWLAAAESRGKLPREMRRAIRERVLERERERE